MGLFGATSVGVGAIVGGGILALAGVAFATTGPAAILAFALNGVIALLTALSFAEMASKFPESGGTYVYSKKVLSVEAAFVVGWIVWFASIVAAVLYAVGFAYFALAMATDLWTTFSDNPPQWLLGSGMVTATAIGTTLFLAFGLIRKSAGGGKFVNISKLTLFGVLILGGLWALLNQPAEATGAALQPFFTSGLGGLVQAMGYTFIALQGFDLIAAVGGEVRNPSKTLPRAMILSLGIALLIYLPLLLVITVVGSPEGQTIAQSAAENPEGIVAIAARQFLGPVGYWLVMVAAILSMYSALQANLYAASRIANAMARDRTLPSRLSIIHASRKTPVVAVMVTAALVSALLLAIPDVGAAGAASSLIFLITFALVHWIAILVRQRSAHRPAPFRVPLFPVVPIAGGLSCLGLAIFQGIAVPAAGFITVIWLSIGGILFLTLFAKRARVRDASNRALDPKLVTLRGNSPLVLVPIANPSNAESMIMLANALVPAEIGRVLTLTVTVPPHDWHPKQDPSPIDRSQHVMRELLLIGAETGVRFESLATVSEQPMTEIARVARLHRCGSVLLGTGETLEDSHVNSLESLLSELDANVVALRSKVDWSFDNVRNILVPIAGRGGQDQLRAQILGSLLRETNRELTLLRVLPNSMESDAIRSAERELRRIADDLGLDQCKVEVVQSDDALQTVAVHADQSDLLILGVQRHARRKKLFGDFIPELAKRTSCPMILISRRG